MVPASFDFEAIATNAGVAATIITAVFLAVRRALKKIKEEDAAPSQATATKIVGGMIMDNTSLLMWSESNRDVVDAIHDNTKELMELRFTMTRLMDKIK